MPPSATVRGVADGPITHDRLSTLPRIAVSEPHGSGTITAVVPHAGALAWSTAYKLAGLIAGLIDQLGTCGSAYRIPTVTVGRRHTCVVVTIGCADAGSLARMIEVVEQQAWSAARDAIGMATYRVERV